jgi:predicted MFS family arabinose efflux permease
MGAGAGLLLPTTLALIAHAVPDLRARSRFVAMWASGLVLGLAGAPLIAGGILHYGEWGWIFSPMALLALVAGLVAFARLPESKSPMSRHHLDWPGQITVTLAIATSIYGVIEGGQNGWGSVQAVLGFVIAATAFTAFIVIEHRSSSPVVDLRVFRSPAFSAAGLSALIALFALVGTLFLLSLFFGTVQQLSAWEIGVRLLFLNAVTAVFNPFIGRLLARWSALLVLGSGLALGAVAMFLIAGIAPDSTIADVGWRLAVLGVADAFMLSAVAIASIQAVPHHLAGMASATNTVLRQYGGALGPAVLGVILSSRIAGGADMTSAVGTALGVNGLLLIAVAVICVLTAWRTRGAAALPSSDRPHPVRDTSTGEGAFR